MLPLGGGGLHKPWGDSSESGMPCCWGTSIETFAGRNMEAIYAHSPTDDTLFVNLFFSSTLTWAARGGLTLSQTAGWPASTTSSTRLVLGAVPAGAPATFTLALRVPGWTAAPGPTVSVNGLPVAGAVPGAYLKIARTWASGDVVDAYFPAALSWAPVTDDRAQFANWGAILYGNVLLAGVNVTGDAAPNHDPARLSEWVTRVPDEARLRFTLAGPLGPCDGPSSAASLVPLKEIKAESYTAYWKVGPRPPPISYNGTAETRLDGSASHWSSTGGASIDGEQIRSGNPGEQNSIRLDAFVDAASHGVAALHFTYNVNAGYGAAGAPGGSNFSVVFFDACSDAVRATWYLSPVISAPSYDACPTCYATVVVNATLPAPVVIPGGPVAVGLVFQDNQRNLNFGLPLDVTVEWA